MVRDALKVSWLRLPHTNRDGGVQRNMKSRPHCSTTGLGYVNRKDHICFLLTFRLYKSTLGVKEYLLRIKQSADALY